MKRKVLLSNRGNVDYGQYAGKPLPNTKSDYFVEVKDEVEAKEVVMNYIIDNDLGSGHWTGGQYFEDGEMVGYFSYNARFWTEGTIFNHMKRTVKVQ